MANLSRYSTKELSDELKKRDKAKKSIPKMKVSPNTKEIEKVAKDYMDYVASDEYCCGERGDWEHWFYEAVLTAYYGNEVFEYINSRS